MKLKIVLLIISLVGLLALTNCSQGFYASGYHGRNVGCPSQHN